MHRSDRTYRNCSNQAERKTFLTILFLKADKTALLVLLGPCLFLSQTFFLVHRAGHHLILPLFSSLIFCLFFGAAALFVEHWLDRLARIFRLRFNRILSLFLLFFILLVGYLLLTSSLISAPMTLVLRTCSFPPESVNLFSLQNTSCALALALVSWLRRLLPLLRKTDGQPMLHFRLTNH